MDGVLNCSGDGWLMITGVVMIYGVLALAGAAPIWGPGFVPLMDLSIIIAQGRTKSSGTRSAIASQC